MAYRVPEFGSWEGGENFTANFDDARKIRPTGQKVNPSDPEDKREIFRQKAPSQNRVDKQRKKNKVPHFGAWENGESAAGYTVCFENARKAKNGDPLVAGNGPQTNRDMHPRSNPASNAQAQGQARPAVAKPETREGRSKVPQFGDWESEGGGGGYTAVFEKLQKKHEPKSKGARDVGLPSKEGRVKVPEFGAWNEAEAVQYTDDFDHAKKNKNLRPRVNSTEPKLHRGSVEKTQPFPETKARVESNEDGFKNPAPRQAKQSYEPRMVHNRGNQAGSIPQFGGWTNDPAQAEGYTETFAKAKEDRKTYLNDDIPHSLYQQQTRHKNQQQPSCCRIL